MKRHYWQYLIDSAGNPVADAKINVYLAGTLNYANIYTTETGTKVTTEHTDILTASDGMFDFWIDNIIDNPTYGYAHTQRFKITWSKDGMTTGGIDNVDIVWIVPDGKVKIDEDDDNSDYLENKIIAGDNITVTVSGEQIVLDGTVSGSSDDNFNYTFTVGASATETFELEDFCNRCLVYNCVITPSVSGSNFDFEIYRDDSFVTIQYALEAVNTTLTDDLPFYLKDYDFEEKLYVKIINYADGLDVEMDLNFERFA
jgi:hypothetical protein